MKTSTQIEEQIVETLADSPTAAELTQATQVTLSDLMRFGSTETQQAIGQWGSGHDACALSAAALAKDALNRL